MPKNGYLSYKQQFAIFWQWPEAVVDDELQLVNLVTDLVELRLNLVVVGDGLLVLVADLVGELTGVDKFLDAFLDGAGTLCYLFDDLEVAGVEFLGLVDAEDG